MTPPDAPHQIPGDPASRSPADPGRRSDTADPAQAFDGRDPRLDAAEPLPAPDGVTGADEAPRLQKIVHRTLLLMLVTLVGIMAAEAMWLRAADGSSPSTWGGLLAIGALGAVALLGAGRRLERHLMQQRSRQLALGAANAAQTAVWNALPAGVVVQRQDGSIQDANPSAERLLGLSRDQLLGLRSTDPRWQALDGQGRALGGDDHPAMVTLRTGQPIQGQLLGIALPDGSRRWLRVSTALFPDANGERQVVAGFVDMTEAMTQRRLLELTVDAAGLGTWHRDLETGRTEWTARCAQMLGHPALALTLEAHEWQSLVHPDDAEVLQQALRDHLSDPVRPYRAEYRMQHAEGHWVWLLATGAVVRCDEPLQGLRLAGVHTDISARKRREQEQALAAETDGLTGLPNRASLQERLTAALTRSAAGGAARVGLLFLDFDHFKRVNDSLGHAAGDELLRRIAERLRAALRPGDDLTQVDGIDTLVSGARADPVAARLGGDEFVVLLEDLSDPQDAQRVAQRLLVALEPAYEIAGRTLSSTASIGVVTCHGGSCDAHELLRRADMAMYEAKRSGRARAVVWQDGPAAGLPPAPGPSAAAVAALQRQMGGPVRLRRTADGQPELQLLYRPIVSLPDLRTLAWIAEPHLTAADPTPGNDRPPPRPDRLALPEGHELHRQAGRWALAQAMRDLSRPTAAGGDDRAANAPIPILLPLSRAQWRDPGLTDRLAAALTGGRLPAGALRLAVSEAVATEDDSSRAALEAVCACGVQVALTAFGSGSASLASLDHLPISEVLLDGGFITRIADSDYQRALVNAVQSVCRALDLRLTADGVEETGQVQALVQLGCAAAAGPLFGLPRGLEARLRPDAAERPTALR